MNETTPKMKQFKSAIIGKIWDNSDNPEKSMQKMSYTLQEDMTFEPGVRYSIGDDLTFLIDRNLNTSDIEGEVEPLTLRTGEILHFYKPKRMEGQAYNENAAKFNVSIHTTPEFADLIIENNKRATEQWKLDNPQTQEKIPNS